MIYEPITEPDSVKDCYDALRGAVGCRTGEGDDAIWDEDRKLYISFYVTPDVYRVSLAPKEGQSGVFQVNPGKQRPNAGWGLFVSDADGRRFLTHSGRFTNALRNGHPYADSDADEVYRAFRNSTDSSRWISVRGQDDQRYLVAPIDVGHSEILDEFRMALDEVVCFKALTGKVAQRGPLTVGADTNEDASLPLNTILFGPPGTGKTYGTIKRCVQICDGRAAEGPECRARYDKLVAEERIRFITFHQSYGYEEFVEGIRPRSQAGQISYAVEDGVLKRMARDAMQAQHDVDVSSPRITPSFDHIWSRLERDVPREVRAQSGREYELGISHDKVVLSPKDGPERSKTKAYIRKMWEKCERSGSPRNATPAKMRELLGRKTTSYTLPVIYNVLWDLAHGQESAHLSSRTANRPNFVLVIDEINRANISKVMGELITLLEEDKREGAENQITVTLPYSREQFTLPKNLHILGTMNTADRSIALLDTALRRRFRFEEMSPQPELLKEAAQRTKVNLPDVVAAMNKRLEYLVDRDHLIGHAWFWNEKSREDVDDVMRHKVIPLIAEYFYDDWSKVRAVLGGTDDFVTRERLDPPPGLDNDMGEDRYSWTVREKFTEDAYELLVTGHRDDGE